MAKKKNKKKKKQHRFFWFTVKLQIVLMILVLGALGYYFFGGYAVQVQDLKKEAVQVIGNSSERDFIPSQASAVYDTSGNLISELRGDKNSTYVKYEDIPADFVTAMISIEDKKYYSHNGVDYRAILRAVKAMVENGQATQGGSTITMQLVKLTYLDNSKTWQRKIEQIFMAIEMEKYYSKSKIMEFYLNNIYFANGYYGVDAACEGYFNCKLDELSLSQIAFLCAIPNSPTYYDPVTNLDHTLTRRNLILSNMLSDGRIDQAAYDAAVAETIALNRPQDKTILKNNYVDTFTYYCATRALMEKQGFEFQYYFDSDVAEAAYDQAYDEVYTACQKQLYGGGYQIYTSIDMEKQAALQSAVDTTLADFADTSEDGIYDMQSAGVSIDNDTGYVVAIVGGRSQEFGTYTLNRAYQSHRQPGSSIKPLIVYTPAFENGYTADSIINDHEFEGGPSNSTGKYYGDVTLRYAVEQSLNTVAWQLYEILTPKVGLQYLKNMNFSKIQPADETPATSLGGFTTGVSALEMASAYATIENDGLYREPTCIKSIIDSDGNVVYASSQVETLIYKETPARMMTNVLESVMTEGLGRNIQLDNMPSAGKTGTTTSNKDGWFCGFTRYYTTAVWVGCDLPKEVEGLKGASYPANIWKTYMNTIHAGLAPMEFVPYAQLSNEFNTPQRDQTTGDEVDDGGAGDAAQQNADPGTTDQGATDPGTADPGTPDEGGISQNPLDEGTGNQPGDGVPDGGE